MAKFSVKFNPIKWVLFFIIFELRCRQSYYISFVLIKSFRQLDCQICFELYFIYYLWVKVDKDRWSIYWFALFKLISFTRVTNFNYLNFELIISIGVCITIELTLELLSTIYTRDNLEFPFSLLSRLFKVINEIYQILIILRSEYDGINAQRSCNIEFKGCIWTKFCVL